MREICWWLNAVLVPARRRALTGDGLGVNCQEIARQRRGILGSEIIELLFQREIVSAKSIHPGLVHRAFGIQEKRAVALGVKRQMFRRNFILGLVFEFQSHDSLRSISVTQ